MNIIIYNHIVLLKNKNVQQNNIIVFNKQMSNINMINKQNKKNYIF